MADDNAQEAARRWQRVESLFAEALDISPTARDGFLDNACGGDTTLRAEVDELLAAHDATGLFDDVIRDGPPSAGQVEDVEGTRIGPYEVESVLGRGGMGVVYLARRADGHFDLEVALKVLPAGSASSRLRQRFLAERQILARLSHPNVARLLDGGVDEQGRPYFAMEHVGGRPLLAYCDEQSLGLRARLDLFLTVCDAVQYAHQNLVVHRDLKPSNILVDGSGQPKLLDFGIAKLLDREADGPASTETEVGLRVLTPAYAAPEQLRGEPANTATDIYQLGILLYELLTGIHPFADESGRLPSASASGRTHDAVRRPSTTFEGPSDAKPSERADNRGGAPDGLRRSLRGDLDAIVLKALRPEPQHRYRSASELAEDIGRYFVRRPVRARPDTWRYRSGRFVRRHAVALTVGAGIVAGGTAFTAGIAREARRTEVQRDRAEAVSRFMTELFANASPFVADGDELTVRALLDDGAERARSSLDAQPLTRAALLEVISDAYWALGSSDEALTLRREALELRRVVPDDGGGVELARAVARLGRYLVQDGDFSTGPELLDEAETAGGPAAPIDASIANDLGLGWQTAGEPERAEAFLEAASEQFLAEGATSNAAAALGNLGWLRVELADPDSAETLFEEALTLRRASLGADHLLVANTLEGLGNLYARFGEPAQAEASFRESLRIRRRGLSEDHAMVHQSLMGLAKAVGQRGQAEEADSLFRHAIAGFEQSYGPDHFATGNARNERAMFLQQQGRIREAVDEFARAERIQHAAFGEDHLSWAVVGANLAWAHFLDGRAADAVTGYERVLPTLLAADPDGMRYRNNQVDYAIALCWTERAEDAVDVFAEAREAIERFAPESDPSLRAANGLGSCLGSLARYEEAEAPLLEVLARTDGRDPSDPYRAFARQALINVYEGWGRPDDARRVANRR